MKTHEKRENICLSQSTKTTTKIRAQGMPPRKNTKKRANDHVNARKSRKPRNSRCFHSLLFMFFVVMRRWHFFKIFHENSLRLFRFGRESLAMAKILIAGSGFLALCLKILSGPTIQPTSRTSQPAAPANQPYPPTTEETPQESKEQNFRQKRPRHEVYSGSHLCTNTFFLSMQNSRAMCRYQPSEYGHMRGRCMPHQISWVNGAVTRDQIVYNFDGANLPEYCACFVSSLRVYLQQTQNLFVSSWYWPTFFAQHEP